MKKRVITGVDPEFHAWIKDRAICSDSSIREVTEMLAKNRYRIEDILNDKNF